MWRYITDNDEVYCPVFKEDSPLEMCIDCNYNRAYQVGQKRVDCQHQGEEKKISTKRLMEFITQITIKCGENNHLNSDRLNMWMALELNIPYRHLFPNDPAPQVSEDEKNTPIESETDKDLQVPSESNDVGEGRYGDWRDDVVKAGIPLHNNGRFSYPVCPVHGWIAIRKKGFNVWTCTKCSFEAKIDEKYYRQWRKEQEEKRLAAQEPKTCIDGTGSEGQSKKEEQVSTGEK